MPVFLRGRYGLVGTVILARSTAPLNSDIVELWVILGTIAVVAMIGAALLAFGLARWVSRPLAGLDTAAGRLADGDLAIRAVVDSGPPELRRLAHDVQHHGRAAGGPGAREPGRDRGRVAPAAHPAGRAAAAARPARRGHRP